MGRKTRQHKEWTSNDAVLKEEEQRTRKAAVTDSKTRSSKKKAQDSELRSGKLGENVQKNCIEGPGEEPEEAAGQQNLM